MSRAREILFCVAVAALAGCQGPWNSPYPAEERGKNILYSAFSERPKHLDPVQSYFENEILFTAQIYMPPLQYHYLKRPYQLVPFAAEALPTATYLDAAGRKLPGEASPAQVARTVYEVRIRPGILYQPHPAFAPAAGGQSRYIGMDA
jgi:oligopeptide transport system substrate-binding protein